MVDIQARFLKVEDNFLEDIGVDFRGLGQPGLGTNNSFNDFGDPSTQLDLGKEIAFLLNLVRRTGVEDLRVASGAIETLERALHIRRQICKLMRVPLRQGICRGRRS